MKAMTVREKIEALRVEAYEMRGTGNSLADRGEYADAEIFWRDADNILHEADRLEDELGQLEMERGE